MVLVATGGNLDMREVLKHPSGLLLWALSNCECTIQTKQKQIKYSKTYWKGSSTSGIYPIAISMHYIWYKLGK